MFAMMNGVENIFILTILVVMGLLFGSFAGAQVWRLRARELRDDDRRLDELQQKKVLSKEEKEEEQYLKKESKARKNERAQLDGLLTGVTEDFSRCLSCGHRLAWYDLLPLISWLSTRGTCRYCHAPIGKFEPLMELGMATVFVSSYIFWPLSLTGSTEQIVFVVWLVSLVLLGILFAYDMKWFILPDTIVFPLIVGGIVAVVVRAYASGNVIPYALGVIGAVLVLSGLYLLLWFMSRGQWVGFGDVKLGLGLALLLGDWQLALLALFLANFIGTLVVLPSMIRGKINRKAHVPFGPLLIAGTFIATLFGSRLINSYLNLLF